MKGQAGEKGNGLMAKLLLPQLLNDRKNWIYYSQILISNNNKSKR